MMIPSNHQTFDMFPEKRSISCSELWSLGPLLQYAALLASPKEWFRVSKLWIFCRFSNYSLCVNFRIMILFLLPKYVSSMSTSDIIVYPVSTYDCIMVHMSTSRLMSLGHFPKFPFTPFDYGLFAFAPCDPFRKSFPPLPN